MEFQLLVPFNRAKKSRAPQKVSILCQDHLESLKWPHKVILTELGISLFEIAQSLFALERTFILGAMALLETKSGAL